MNISTHDLYHPKSAIGRGGSSKPSDGLKGKFPHYRYYDMVESGYRLITEGLGVAQRPLQRIASTPIRRTGEATTMTFVNGTVVPLDGGSLL